MQKTKIEWVRNADGSQGYVWNPIKGVCPVNCMTPDGKSYCYARSFYFRFHRPTHTVFDPRPGFIPKTPSTIFVCSTYEIFHPRLSELVGAPPRDIIFYVINKHPEHNFVILTKMPENINRPMPDNVWLGVSITESKDWWRYRYLKMAEVKHRFLSIEPLIDPNFRIQELRYIDWVIIGRLTGHGNKFNPSQDQVQKIIDTASLCSIPVFMKNNLKDTCDPGSLVQDLPVGLGR